MESLALIYEAVSRCSEDTAAGVVPFEFRHQGEAMERNQEAIAVGLSTISRLLSLSERTVWGLTKNGQIPHFRVGRRLLFPRDEVLRWAEQQSQQVDRPCVDQAQS